MTVDRKLYPYQSLSQLIDTSGYYLTVFPGKLQFETILFLSKALGLLGDKGQVNALFHVRLFFQV